VALCLFPQLELMGRWWTLTGSKLNSSWVEV
jgi:hypothetical protein